MQNINLYQPERRAAGGPRARQLLLGFGLVMVVLAGQAGWQGWQLHTARERAIEAEQLADRAEAELAQVKADFHEPVLDSSLPRQLAEREAENRELRRLADYLKTLDAQRSTGFAALLQGLADRHPPQGLWLTRIRFDDGGNQLALQGLTQDQELLPRYLQSLGQSSAFRGRDFARFDIQRREADLLQFRLASRARQEDTDE